jgi:hypothetical protein
MLHPKVREKTFNLKFSDYLNRWDDQVSIPGRGNFFFNLCVQSGSGGHPAPYPVSTGRPFSRVKRGRGVSLTTHPHLGPRSRMSRSYTSSLPPIVSMACSGTDFLFLQLDEYKVLNIHHAEF